MSNSTLLWCCAGCLRGEDNCTEYYTLLGLEPGASQEAIHRAWRTASLRMHPDKIAQRRGGGGGVTAEDTAAFAKLKDAHAVLADPLRRRVYDAYGANGVKWTEDPSTVDPNEVLRNFTHASTGDRCRIVVVIVGLLGAAVLFPFLLCVKVDMFVHPLLCRRGGGIPPSCLVV